jgi:hypothetical protein
MSPITESRRARIILAYSLAFDADRCPNMEDKNARTVAASEGEDSRNSNDCASLEVSNRTLNSRVCKESIKEIKAI